MSCPPSPEPAPRSPITLRQRLMELLSQAERGFDELCEILDLSVRELESELRHVDRTARSRGSRLLIRSPRCRECGFDFPGRASHHLHPPGRCPRCRKEWIAPPRFRIQRVPGHEPDPTS